MSLYAAPLTYHTPISCWVSCCCPALAKQSLWPWPSIMFVCLPILMGKRAPTRTKDAGMTSTWVNTYSFSQHFQLLNVTVFQKHTKCYMWTMQNITFLETHTQCYNRISKCYCGGSIMLYCNKSRGIVLHYFPNVIFVAGQCYPKTLSNQVLHSISTNITLTTTQYHRIFFTPHTITCNRQHPVTSLQKSNILTEIVS